MSGKGGNVMKDDVKDIQDHPEFKELAKRADDLRYILLKYGTQLGKALSAVQKEFKAADQKCQRLATKLEKEGYVAYC